MRSRNTGSSRGAVEFLNEALALLPKGMGIRCVRADSGFFDQKLLRFLEEIGFSYIVVAKLSRQMKLKLCGWDVERRFVVLRERIREEKEAAFLGVVLSFSLLLLYQAGVTRESGYRKPLTLRMAVFVGGAILGRKGRDLVLRFSESWGGLKKHIPLIKEAWNAGNPIAPLLRKPPGEREIFDALACGGYAI